VRPDEALTRTDYTPGTERLSAHERAEHFALDLSGVPVGRDPRKMTVNSLEPNYEGVIASGFDAE
jgi:hypothetical protein